MACRVVLHQAKRELQGDFPSDPGVGTVADLARAADYVLSSPGWSNAPAAWGRWQIRAHVEGRVADEARRLDATLTDGSWRERFSGKEILRWVRGRNFGLDAMPAAGHSRDANLALRVVRAMEDMGRIPRVGSRSATTSPPAPPDRRPRHVVALPRCVGASGPMTLRRGWPHDPAKIARGVAP